jgi:hypothetical protein
MNPLLLVAILLLVLGTTLRLVMTGLVFSLGMLLSGCGALVLAGIRRLAKSRAPRPIPFETRSVCAVQAGVGT